MKPAKWCKTDIKMNMTCANFVAFSKRLLHEIRMDVENNITWNYTK